MKRSTMTMLASAFVVILSASAAWCQGDEMGLGDLLGGMGGLGGLGMLGALGGGMSAGAAGTPVIVEQPAMLVYGGSLYIAYKGKVTKFSAETLQKQGEAYFDPPPAASLQPLSTGTGPQLIEPTPGMPKPPLVPGAEPATGP